MPQILEQRISIDAHNREHTQRNQCDGHNDDADGGRHRDPHQFRIAYQNYECYCLNGIPCFHHTAQQLAGVSIVRRNGIHIAVFAFFHTTHHRITSPVEMYRMFRTGMKARLVSSLPTVSTSSGLHALKRLCSRCSWGIEISSAALITCPLMR